MESKYPIYKKSKNGKEFMKLNSDGFMIKVYFLKDNRFTIVHTDNKITVSEMHDLDLTDESTRDEWEKAYGQAQYLLCKSNCEQ